MFPIQKILNSVFILSVNAISDPVQLMQLFPVIGGQLASYDFTGRTGTRNWWFVTIGTGASYTPGRGKIVPRNLI